MTLKEAMDIVQQLTAQERFAEAQQVLTAVEAVAPRQPSVAYAMGVIADRQGRAQDAIAHFERAVAWQPHQPMLHWGLAIALLTAGDLARGWKENEWRLMRPELKLSRSFAQPRWTGEEIGGRTILLHAEGGHGDAIHFCRYAPMVAQRGATVILECQAALLRLLGTLPGVTATVARGQALPPMDYQCSLASLPLIFGTTLDSIPANVPYLTAPSELVAAWRTRLGPRLGLRVGLCWAGSSLTSDVRSRSLSIFAPLAEVGGIEFHSLQAGPQAREAPPPGLRLIDHADDLTDFTQTAALVENLDLVISVDTSVAHLAGALGRETWVLIPRIADYRWLRDRTDSPWYPTMRLFRQEIGAKDWSAVAQRLADAVEDMIDHAAGSSACSP